MKVREIPASEQLEIDEEIENRLAVNLKEVRTRKRRTVKSIDNVLPLSSRATRMLRPLYGGEGSEEPIGLDDTLFEAQADTNDIRELWSQGLSRYDIHVKTGASFADILRITTKKELPEYTDESEDSLDLYPPTE